MFAVLFIAVLAAICILGGVYGADSRLDERERRGHRV
jgi:hypothetical protein